MIDLMQVANNADMIINGYAFTKDNDNLKILNLNNEKKSVYMNKNGNVLVTNMDDIELEIVKSYLSKNKEFLED